MFRVVGRDARGNREELSVVASTAEEARAVALRAGLVSVEGVSASPPTRRPLFRLDGFALGALAVVGFFGSIVSGAVIGGWMGDQTEPPGFHLRQNWIGGAVGGAAVGLVVGIGIVAVCYRRYRGRG